MAWVLVEPLKDFRTQLNVEAPERDTESDGSVGDWQHQQGDSDHNPDDTGKGNAGWDGDPDSTEEVRAIDVDKDFNADFTPAEFLAHLLKYCRNGTFWWIRYIIFEGHIYHKNVNNYEKRVYTGENKHDHHFHISSDHTQKADNYKAANYRFEELSTLNQQDRDWLASLVRTEVAKAVQAAQAATAAIKDSVELSSWTTGGGLKSEVGNAVLNAGWPLEEGAQRTPNWANLQEVYALLKTLEERTRPVEPPA